MKNVIFILAAALLCTANADLLDCDEKILPSLSDVPVIGEKLANPEDKAEHKVRDFFKNVGCQIKSGAETVSDKAKELGSDLKQGAQNLGEKAKDLGSDIKEKISELKGKFSSDSSHEHTAQRLVSDVEIINPDLLRIEQQCGHGHILDALGNCSKLRK